MLEVKNLVKEYKTKGGATVRALADVSINFPEKGMVFLLGKSGSGKSTLLNVAGGLDRPDSGEIIVKGRSSKDFSASDFDSYRNTCVGFVFQEYNILNEFTIEQNIALALQLQNKKNDKAAVNALLEQVDLKGLGKRKPNTLSGGQKQRVAIARALIKDPEIIMADEPTGALDSGTGKQIFDTLKKLSETRLVIIVSHDREFAEHYADRIIELADGKVISDVTKTFAEPQKISENVSVVSDDTIRIEKTENITEEDVKNIVDILKRHGGEAIIASGDKKLADVKRACKLSADGTEETFKNTGNVPAKKYDGKAKFIKSKLPVSHAFKIGASGLKTKPVRLVFTVFLSVIAFSLFGVLSAFMTYNPDYSVAKALQEADYPAAAVNASFEYEYTHICANTEKGTEEVNYTNTLQSETGFSEADIRNLNNGKHGLKFAGVYVLSQNRTGIPLDVSPETQKDYFPETRLKGFSDCGEKFLQDNGFKLLNGRFPANASEIAVSEYIDNLYKAAGFDSALNKTIEIKGYSNEKTITLKIAGIYRTGFIDGKFDELKMPSDSLSINDKQNRDKLVSNFKDYLKNSFALIAFVSDDFYGAHNVQPVSTRKMFISTSSFDGITIANSPITDSSRNYADLYTEKSAKRNVESFTFYDLDKNKLKNFAAKDLSLKQLEVYVPLRQSEDVEISGKTKTSETSPEQLGGKYYFKNSAGESGEFIVKGYYTNGNDYSDPCELIVSDEFITNVVRVTEYTFTVSSTKYVADGELKYSFALAKTNNSLEQISYILKGEPERGVVRSIDNDVCSGIQLMIELIKALSTVFLIVGLILGGFAALLLLNFISASIAAKTKEIGILRAVGARGADVFRIFFSEAFIFAMICFVLSSIGAGILCNAINNSVMESTIIPTAALLNFNVLNVGITLLISLFVSAIATFIPVFKAARKSPVDSIRTL